MKPLSPRTTELLAALEVAPSVRARLRGAEDERVHILARLAETPEPAVVPHLLPLLVEGPVAVARAAAHVVSRVVALTASADLLQMDAAWRRAGWYASPSKRGWWTLAPTELARLAELDDAGTAVVGVASFHPNGYVREAAVKQLDLLGGGRELPFLLIRLNDWVPAVADRARAAVARRIAPGYGRAFLEHLPILFRLSATTRRRHGDLLERVYALLRAPDEREALEWGLRSVNTATRRVAFRLARESERDDRGDLLARALRDPDAVVRLAAVADARRGGAGSALAALLPVVVADPYPRVRREGLAAAAERLPDQADAWLRAALLDRNVVVREVARFFLRRRGAITDFAAFYRDHARRDAPARELAAAVAGVGETGGSGDVGIVTPFLAHERAAVRRAAVRAAGALDLAGHVARVSEMLWDEAPSVSHAARDLVRPHAPAVGAASLLRVVRGAPHVHSQLDALSVAASLGKWESLPVLIEGTAAADDRVRRLAGEQLVTWIAKQNQRFTRPTPGQVAAIGAAVHAHHLALGRAVAGEIMAALRVWTP